MSAAKAANGHGLWILRESIEAQEHSATAFYLDPENRVVNHAEFDEMLTELLYTRSMKIAGDPLIPDGSPRPILSMPPLDFEPDFFNHQNLLFVSRRLREALAQPPDVVQYWPVDLIRASDEAYEQDYMLMRILAWQEAMDKDRSIYTREDIVNRRAGEELVFISYIQSFVPRPDLVPRTEIFRSAESGLTIFVTDALAERVLRAGCDGVSFREPETIGLWGRVQQRLRTAHGIKILDPELPAWETFRASATT